ncbi:MAG: tRNA guanosine(34) transglycosylase Tgt [bacterium]
MFRRTFESPDTSARVGVLRTSHGPVETPVFMPVGTQGSVKAISPHELREIGFSIILNNTYHLYLRPGHRLIERMGGLHKFTGWDGSILTDSGGFQIYSLSKLFRVSDEGVSFKSHVDGSTHFISPEDAISIQRALGGDVMMVLDQCVRNPCERELAEESVRRTSLWAERGLERFRMDPADRILFGIVQGSTYTDLRMRSAGELVDMDFPGYAIGGLSVGESKEETREVLEFTAPLLPLDKPRYLMGVGDPEGILEAVERGIDMFDCVMPTRIARNGTVLTRWGRLVIKSSRYREDSGPIEEGCGCYACRHFSRAYIRHLLNVREILGVRLTTYHNLYFMSKFMRDIRDAIRGGRFRQFKSEFLSRFSRVSEGEENLTG